MTRKTIALSEETYRKLERYKLELMQKKKSTKISFDEVIKVLLEECGERRLKK